MPPRRENVEPRRPGFTLISTYAAALQAAHVLSCHRVLVVDCEGHRLGRPGGALTLISIGTRYYIFLLDVLSLPDASHPSLAPLLSLLTNKDVLKVFWDGRTDVLEIRLTYGIAVEGVLDLQLVEVVSRKQRQSAKRRLNELAKRYFEPIKDELAANPSVYEGIYQLLGLDMCLGILGLAKGQLKDRDVVAMHKANGTEMWLKRPLPDKLLEYSAHDIELILVLYRHFTQQAWVKKGDTLEQLKAQSARYVSIYRTREMRLRHDDYQLSKFMNLGVVDMGSPAPSNAPTFVCARCELQLPARSFTVNLQMSGPAQGARRASIRSQRWSFCKLCSAITRRNKEADQGAWVTL